MFLHNYLYININIDLSNIIKKLVMLGEEDHVKFINWLNVLVIFRYTTIIFKTKDWFASFFQFLMSLIDAFYFIALIFSYSTM